jgi:threonine/homoserine/homoserine lactone efflux protein
VPTLATILVFSAVAAGVAAVPGPSNMFVLSRGIGFGPRPAIYGAAGCATGAFTYVLLTAVGLAAVIASSEAVFSAIHYAGAAYLIYLGIRAIRSGASFEGLGPAGSARAAGAYRQGVLVELTNPKVALFFLALFPQFVHPSQGAAWTQILVLGLLFCAIGFLSDSIYALGSGAIGNRLRRSTKASSRLSRLAGGIYIGLGAWALAGGSSASSRSRA